MKKQKLKWKSKLEMKHIENVSNRLKFCKGI